MLGFWMPGHARQRLWAAEKMVQHSPVSAAILAPSSMFERLLVDAIHVNLRVVYAIHMK